MFDNIRYLLFQIRNPDDPIIEQEIGCFSRALHCDPAQIEPHDLLEGAPRARQFAAADMVLIGGSGHYSAAGKGDWLERALDALRMLRDRVKPTFASCWGFQAMARALGGEVVYDPDRAELGTLEMRLTDAGAADPLFGRLNRVFRVQAGHQDRVATLPPGATLLASTELVENQAYRLDDMPIYATQFHPELDLATLLGRVKAYPEYVARIAGVPMDQFIRTCAETPDTQALLRRFVEQVFGD